MEDDMELLDEPVDDAAKPSRRANHRLNRGSDSAAELGLGDHAADVDTSDDLGGSSDHDGGGPVEALLRSDDSGAPEVVADRGGADRGGSDEDMGAVEADMNTGGAGTRKRGHRGGQGGSASVGKQKRRKCEEPELAGWHVTAPGGQNGPKQKGTKLHGRAAESRTAGGRSMRVVNGTMTEEDTTAPTKKTGKAQGKRQGKQGGSEDGVPGGGAKRAPLSRKGAAELTTVPKKKTKRASGHAQ